jgi:hypothetical protein
MSVHYVQYLYSKVPVLVQYCMFNMYGTGTDTVTGNKLEKLSQIKFGSI